jgi:hypothetical protein
VPGSMRGTTEGATPAFFYRPVAWRQNTE